MHSDLPFLSERVKIDKCNKLVCNLYDKKCYVVHIRSLKQGLNHRLILTKVHRVIQFNQKLWLKLYVDMNTELRKQAKNDFEKDFFKLMNTAGFEKIMENVRKHRDDKKAKGTKKCVIKRRLKFNDYKDCLLNNETILKSQQRFKSEKHDVYTEGINKIALSSNDDKILQTFDKITSYPYGTITGKVCKIYLYAKDPCEAKYQYLINKREKVGLDHFRDPEVFMEYSNNMQDVYKNIVDYNPYKKRKTLIIFENMIADMINNKN